MIKIEHLNKYYNKGKSNEIHVINDTNEGRDISSHLEGLVSCYSDMEIGSVIDSITIVGKYNLNTNLNEKYNNKVCYIYFIR